MSLNAVLFDLYGTILDIEVDEDSPRLWHGLAASIGKPGATVEPSDVRQRFQALLKNEADRGREGFLLDAVFRRLLSSFEAGEDVARIGKLFRELSLKEIRLRPYVEPVFELLRRSGVKLGIVSNTEAVLTRFDLDRYPILRTIQTVVLSSEVGMRKPDPQIFRLALERIGYAPLTAVFVGNDWVADIGGARDVGLRAVYINDHAAESIRVVTGPHDVIEVAPTLEAITSALRMCGWQEHRL
jgi:putative hydrolase of the HAD superfamily